MIKRIISLLLSVAMLTSCMVITGFAAENPELTVLSVNKITDETTGEISDEPVMTVSAGDIIAVTVGIKAKSEQVSVSGYQFHFHYNDEYFSLWSQTTTKKGNFYGKSVDTGNLDSDVSTWTKPTVGTSETGKVILTVSNVETTSDYTSLNCTAQANEQIDLVQIAFKVKDDVESGTTSFSFDNNDDNKIIYYASSDSAKTSILPCDMVGSTLNVNGVAPTVTTVTLNPSTVTVNGTNKQTVQAKATSAKGTDLTNSVTWSIGTPENGSGVTIDENGAITVAANAKAGAYTVYANRNSSGGGGGSGSTNRSQSAAARSEVQGSAQATLTVSRETPVAKELAISADKSMVEIPTDNNVATAKFTAAFRDQYGDEMTAPSVTWSIADAVNGVSISNGVVTVTKDAKNSITDSKKFTITATSGTLSRTSTLTVKRTAPQVNSIELGSVDAMIVPANGADATANVTATVKDQYGAEISGASVAWSIAPKVTGVSIDNNGKITVTNAAKAGITNTTGTEFTVTATSGTVTAEKKFHVKRDAQTAKTLVICKDGVELAGDTDTVIIPTTDTANEYTYTVKIFDQYGAAMTADSNVTISVIGDASADAISGNKLTISKTATKDKKYKVMATCGTLTKEVTVTVKDIDITWPAATVAQSPVYGASWKDIVTGFTGGSATLNGETVNGQFTLKTPNEIPNAGNQTYVVNFTGTLNGVSYNIDKTYDAVQIAQKSVTITGLSASNKEYNGNNVATPTGTATISGKLAKDELTVTAGTASFADKNVGTNKTVTFTGYALSGAAAGNYELSAQPASVTANITQKELTVGAGTLKFTKEYNGETDVTNSTKTGELTLTGVVHGDTVSIASGYTAAYENANVGTDKKVTLSGLTLDGADKDNYKLASATLEVSGNSITKATYGDKTATSSAKYGTTGTLDLSPYLVSDATIGQITTADTNFVLDTSVSPSVANNILTYRFKNDANLKDKTATITVPVTSGNYENYSITVTVTVLDKLPQSNFKFAEATQTKTYGDSKFTYAATGAVDGSTVTYSSDNTEVATVDANTGEVTILKAGTAVITATAPATDDYAAATQTYTLTVNKAKLTVRPKSYTIRVGDTLPTPEVEYVGLKNNDKAKDVAKLDTGKKLDLEIKNADKTGTLENSSTTGTYEIAFKETPTFQATDNYDIEVVATGTLTINSRPSGSGGSSSTSTYPVSVTTPKNGKVTVSPSNAAKGAAVTVTVTPDSGYEMDKLTVTDASGKTISTTDKGNGKFTFTMPNGKVSVSATFKQTTVTPPSTGFVDVPASAYYADAVKWAVEKGITTGTSATTFSPEASCTRAQMVTFLWRAAGSPAPKATTTAFTDLDKSAYYYDAVLWAVEQGITTGTSSTTFSPNATVTRGQTVTFLYRFAGQPAVSGSSSFTDVNSSDYYAAAVQWAKEQGITSGTSDTTFSPTNDCARGQIVTFLYRQLAK